MRTFVILVTLLILSATAAAAEELATAAMDGPYAHPFKERCADLTKADPDAACKRVRAKGDVQVWSFGSDEYAAYYVAMKTKVGWYVSATPIQLALEDGHAGSFDMGKVDAIMIRKVGKTTAVELRVSYETWCDMCEPKPKQPSRRYQSAALLVCNGDACTAPITTTGDAIAPPRFVHHKLRLAGASDGQNDLEDGDYTIAW